MNTAERISARNSINAEHGDCRVHVIATPRSAIRIVLVYEFPYDSTSSPRHPCYTRRSYKKSFQVFQVFHKYYQKWSPSANTLLATAAQPLLPSSARKMRPPTYKASNRQANILPVADLQVHHPGEPPNPPASLAQGMCFRASRPRST